MPHDTHPLCNDGQAMERRMTKLEEETKRLRETLDGNGKPGLKHDFSTIAVSLAETVRTTAQWRESTEHTLSSLGEKLDALRVHLYSRPSWLVTASLSFLTALSVGLMVAMFKR